jgi:hypothetical protein
MNIGHAKHGTDHYRLVESEGHLRARLAASTGALGAPDPVPDPSLIPPVSEPVGVK